MGRKNRRHAPPVVETYVPIAAPPGVKTQAQIERERKAREDRDHEKWIKASERRRKEINQRVNWSACMVPLCDGHAPNPADLPNETEKRLPLCHWHQAVVWRQVEHYEGREGIAKSTEQLAAEQREREEQAKRRRLARQDGHIYYVRLNGLIKVGWSREVTARLRAYGPDVEILCVHRGTRQDETNLHRNLRPFLARGREWYEDSDAMRDLVARAVEKHGRGSVRIEWTRPAEKPIKLRRR